tara:strand:+ start:485 stop:1072 length:588 start_codon:yes stop_codon:yes gene_type:complete
MKNINDLIYYKKNHLEKAVCDRLINFYEENIHLTFKEKSYKYEEDSSENQSHFDNYNVLNISKLGEIKHFKDIFEETYNYINQVVLEYEKYLQDNFFNSFQNTFYNYTNNIRIIKYEIGQCIKDHSDVADNIRGSCTINLNDNYEGGEFRFFNGKKKIKLNCGEAIIFPAEPIWIHGTDPIIKGARYSINCFLRQ